MRRVWMVLASAGILSLVCWSSGDSAQVGREGIEDADVLPEGMDVLTRGPVHEAFAQPVIRDPEPAPVLPKEPPEPVPELPPELKPEGTNVVWIPGYWAWDTENNEFLWVSGLWRDVPPDRTWVPGYWHAVEGGNQWVAGYWAIASQPEVTLLPPPPEPIAEAIPPAPDAASVYIPGCWVHVETRYYWRPGYFVQYRPGWVWVPACYYWSPAGYVFVDGYWDRDFDRRGLLFAPVRFTEAAFYRRPGFVYTPRYSVYSDVLLTSLFLRGGGWRNYYFGNYYEPRFARSGYVAWVDVRFGGGRFYDPVYSYYRWRYRDQPRWETEIRSVYAARREGTLARPPVTLREQIKLTSAGTIKESNQLVTSINRFKATERTSVKLTSVTKTEITQVTKRIEEIRQVRDVRRTTEAKVRAKGGTRTEAVRVELPVAKMAATGTPAAKGEAAPPPLPRVPKTLPKGFEGKIGDTPKGKDFDIPKGKDRIDPLPKGKGKDDFPKGKDFDIPKGKDRIDPFPKGKGKDDFPKGKDFDIPKGKDRIDSFPKGKGKDDFPKGKDFDIPKGKDRFDPFPKGKGKDDFPKGKDFDIPKGKDRIDSFPKGKGKDFDVPRGKDRLPVTPKVPDLPGTKDFDPPRGKDFDRPRGKDRDDDRRGPGAVGIPRPGEVPPAAAPVDRKPISPPALPIPKGALPQPPRTPDVTPPRINDPSTPTPAAPARGKERKKDRDRD